jgi:DNA polymerase-3 subunit gamma/tau
MLAPARANKKVYIIDEAHMLTTEASNALLKTLEEPPAHVVFILATTNPEKLIETIRSRTFSINFKKATSEEIVRSLSKVISGEKIKADKKILMMVAEASDGSFRDAVKILEELTLDNKKLIDKFVEEYLFSKRLFDVDKFFEFLYSQSAHKAISLIESAVTKGVLVKAISISIIRCLRESYLAKIGMKGIDLGLFRQKPTSLFSKTELILLIKLFSKSLSQIPESVIDQLPLEIAIAEWCEEELNPFGKPRPFGSELRVEEVDAERSRGIKTQNSLRAGPESKLKTKSEGGNNKSHSENSSSNPIKKDSKSVTDIVKSVKKTTVSVTEEVWRQILAAVRPKNTSTEALLRAARPMNYDGNTLELGVFYRFHKERLEMREHRSLLEDVASEIFGSQVKIVCSLTEQPVKVESEEINTNALSESEDNDIVKVAKEIFGS